MLRFFSALLLCFFSLAGTCPSKQRSSLPSPLDKIIARGEASVLKLADESDWWLRVRAGQKGSFKLIIQNDSDNQFAAPSLPGRMSPDFQLSTGECTKGLKKHSRCEITLIFSPPENSDTKEDALLFKPRFLELEYGAQGTAVFEIKTTTYGKTRPLFLPQNHPNCRSIYPLVKTAHFSSDGRYLYIATLGGLAVSRDHGKSFITLTVSDGLPSNFITAIAEKDGTLYIAVILDKNTLPAYRIYKSLDLGQHWSLVTTRPAKINAISFLRGELYIADKTGLHVHNAGTTSTIYSQSGVKYIVSTEHALLGGLNSKELLHFEESTNTFSRPAIASNILATACDTQNCYYIDNGKLYRAVYSPFISPVGEEIATDLKLPTFKTPLGIYFAVMNGTIYLAHENTAQSASLIANQAIVQETYPLVFQENTPDIQHIQASGNTIFMRHDDTFKRSDDGGLTWDSFHDDSIPLRYYVDFKTATQFFILDHQHVFLLIIGVPNGLQNSFFSVNNTQTYPVNFSKILSLANKQQIPITAFIHQEALYVLTQNLQLDAIDCPDPIEQHLLKGIATTNGFSWKELQLPQEFSPTTNNLIFYMGAQDDVFYFLTKNQNEPRQSAQIFTYSFTDQVFGTCSNQDYCGFKPDIPTFKAQMNGQLFAVYNKQKLGHFGNSGPTSPLNAKNTLVKIGILPYLTPNKRLLTDIPSAQFPKMTFSAFVATSTLLYTTTPNGLFTSSDYGQSWQKKALKFLGSLKLKALSYDSRSGLVYIGTELGIVQIGT